MSFSICLKQGKGSPLPAYRLRKKPLRRKTLPFPSPVLFRNTGRGNPGFRLLAPGYHGANTLYKDHENGMFILALAPSDHSAGEFNRVCNMLSEYGSPEKASPAVLAFLEEHCETVVSANAVQRLAGSRSEEKFYSVKKQQTL